MYTTTIGRQYKSDDIKKIDSLQSETYTSVAENVAVENVGRKGHRYWEGVCERSGYWANGRACKVIFKGTVSSILVWLKVVWLERAKLGK
jgi:hypothetical protein